MEGILKPVVNSRIRDGLMYYKDGLLNLEQTMEGIERIINEHYRERTNEDIHKDEQNAVSDVYKFNDAESDKEGHTDKDDKESFRDNRIDDNLLRSIE